MNFIATILVKLQSPPIKKLDDTYECGSDYDLFFIRCTPTNGGSSTIKKLDDTIYIRG